MCGQHSEDNLYKREQTTHERFRRPQGDVFSKRNLATDTEQYLFIYFIFSINLLVWFVQ